MARAKIPVTVLGPDGRPFLGASVTVRRRIDAVNATVYSAETGSGTLSNPLASDVSGRVGGWVDRGGYECVISGSGLTTYTEPFDAVPGGDSSLDGGVLVDDAIIDRHIAPGAIPIGTLLPAAGTLPGGTDWLSCDGTAVSRTTYAELFAAISTRYGAGDGSTTFNLPDGRGRPLFGKGTHTDHDTAGKSDGLAVGSRRAKHGHYSPWPFAENGGGGNFIAAIRSADQSLLTAMGYVLRMRTTLGSLVLGGINKVNAGGSAQAGVGFTGYDPLTDTAVGYDVLSDLQAGSYLTIEGWIIRAK